MHDYKKDFFDFNDVIWLNAASEGPLPNAAAEALKQAVYWKSAVHLLDIPKFVKVPVDLKSSLAELMHVDSRDVILGTSASYGLHILANGIPWQTGDEILVMQNDFPTNILPWLGLERKGVVVKQIKPREWMLKPQEIEQEISTRTRLICLSHVHSFSGHALDVEGVSSLCRSRGIRFVLNIVQSLGNMPLDVSALQVDAIVAVGYKWLCGPYGTGFCWIKEDFRRELDLNRTYWSSSLREEELKSEGPLAYKPQNSARKYDMFGTANFFNYVPLTACVRYWLAIGIDRVQAHNQALIDQLIKDLNRSIYRIISPTEPGKRTNLLVFSHLNPHFNGKIVEALQQNNIYPAFWKGNIRLTPHIYNNGEDISKVLDVLNKE